MPDYFHICNPIKSIDFRMSFLAWNCSYCKSYKIGLILSRFYRKSNILENEQLFPNKTKRNFFLNFSISQNTWLRHLKWLKRMNVMLVVWLAVQHDPVRVARQLPEHNATAVEPLGQDSGAEPAAEDQAAQTAVPQKCKTRHRERLPQGRHSLWNAQGKHDWWSFLIEKENAPGF